MSNDKLKIIADLTHIAGKTPEAWSDSCIAWFGEDDYWLRLLDANEDGEKLLIHVDEDEAPEFALYAIIGYIQYHEIDHSFTNWDDFINN